MRTTRCRDLTRSLQLLVSLRTPEAQISSAHLCIVQLIENAVTDLYCREFTEREALDHIDPAGQHRSFHVEPAHTTTLD
jgi:hypothetical protein